MPSLADFLSAVSDDDDDSPKLTDVQIIARLTEYHAQVFASEPERFEPGQIIWHKWPELADTREAEFPGIFIRYLDTPIHARDYIREPSDLGSTSAARTMDALRGCISEGCFAVHFFDSRTHTATPPRNRK